MVTRQKLYNQPNYNPDAWDEWGLTRPEDLEKLVTNPIPTPKKIPSQGLKPILPNIPDGELEIGASAAGEVPTITLNTGVNQLILDFTTGEFRPATDTEWQAREKFYQDFPQTVGMPSEKKVAEQPAIHPEFPSETGLTPEQIQELQYGIGGDIVQIEAGRAYEVEERAKAENIIKAVYPDTNIENFEKFILDTPQDFAQSLLDKGRTPQTETLLSALGVNPDYVYGYATPEPFESYDKPTRIEYAELGTPETNPMYKLQKASLDAKYYHEDRPEAEAAGKEVTQAIMKVITAPFEMIGMITRGIGTGRNMFAEADPVMKARWEKEIEALGTPETNPAYYLQANTLRTKQDDEIRHQRVQEAKAAYEELPIGEQLLWELPAFIDILPQLGKLVVKGVTGAQAKGFEMLLNNGLDRTIASINRGIPAENFSVFQQKLYKVFKGNESKVAQMATDNLVKRMGRGKVTEKMMQEAIDDTLTQLKTELLPAVTPGGSAVPGQTKSLQEIMGSVENRLGQPAVILKKLPTVQETTKLTELQALAKEKGLDLEAVEGISEGEYWVSITSPTLSMNEKMSDWVQTLREQNFETSETAKKLLEGKFEARESEPAFGRKRFVPFKTLEEAEIFLKTGEFKPTALGFKGQPMTPEQVKTGKADIAQREAEAQERDRVIQPQIEKLDAQIAEAKIKSDEAWSVYYDKYGSTRNREGTPEYSSYRAIRDEISKLESEKTKLQTTPLSKLQQPTQAKPVPEKDIEPTQKPQEAQEAALEAEPVAEVKEPIKPTVKELPEDVPFYNDKIKSISDFYKNRIAEFKKSFKTTETKKLADTKELITYHEDKLKSLEDYFKQEVKTVSEAKDALREFETSYLKDQVDSITDYYRNKIKQKAKEVKIKQDDIKAIKQQLMDVAKSAPLPIRGKFLAAMKNVKDEKGLDTAITRIGELTEAYTAKELRNSINKMLADLKIPKKGGIARSKLTPETQKQIDQIKINLKGDRAAARASILDNAAAFDKGEITQEELWARIENAQTTGIDGMNVRELQQARNIIDQVIKQGKSDKKAKLDALKEERTNRRAKLSGVITGGKGLKVGTGIIPSRELTETKGWLDKLINNQYGWRSLLDKLSQFDKTSGRYKSALSEFGRIVDRATSVETAGTAIQMDKVLNIAKSIYGTKNAHRLNIILNKNRDEIIDLGMHKALDGTMVHLKLTKNQIMAKYVQMNDPTLQDTFKEGMKWSYSMDNAIANAMTDKDVAFADAVMDYYVEYYDSINEVFREVYGVDMPKNPFYSPLSRDVESDTLPENILTMRDSLRYSSYQSGHWKERVGSIATLKSDDIVSTLLNHIIQMEHNKAWALPLSELRSVFGHSDIRTAIKQYHGRGILSKIDSMINDFARGGIDRAQVIHGLDQWRFRITKSILAKPVIALKQIPSVVGYMTEMNSMTDYVAGIADFWKHPRQNHKFLMENSPYYYNRFKTGEMERDISIQKTRTETQRLTNTKNFTDWFMLHIRMGDKFAVTQGMWTIYKAGMKGKEATPENIRAAMARAEEASQNTQPSGELFTLSAWQRGGSLFKLFTMFQNQPNKYFRIIADNERNFMAGRGSKVDAIKNISIAWILAPLLFNMIEAGFKKDKEWWELPLTIALGPVNFLLIAGNVIQSITGWIGGDAWDYQASPVFGAMQDVKNAISKTRKVVGQKTDPYKDIQTEDVISAIEYYAKSIGSITGLPMPYAVQAERAIREGRLAGLVYSQYALGEVTPDTAKIVREEAGKVGDTKETTEATEEKIKRVEEVKTKEGLFLPREEEVVTTNDLDNNLRRKLGDKLPSEILEAKGMPLDGKIWAQKELDRLEADLLPNIPLYKIVDDGTHSVDDYVKMFKALQGITDAETLKAFLSDETTRDARLGNLTPQQKTLLKQYNETRDKDKFLKEHPQLKLVPRDEWLKDNPEANARMAIFGDAKLMSVEADTFARGIAKQLGYGEDVLPDKLFKPEHLVKGWLEGEAILDEHHRNPDCFEYQLHMLNNDELRRFLGNPEIDTDRQVLETEVKWRSVNDIEKAFSGKVADETGNFVHGTNWKDNEIKDENGLTERDRAIDELAKDNPEWQPEMWKAEAIRKGAKEEGMTQDEIDTRLDEMVDHKQTDKEYGTGSIQDKLWKVKHWDFTTWASNANTLGWTTDLDELKAQEERLEIDVEYNVEDDAYNALPDDDKVRESYLRGDGLRGKELDRRLEYAHQRRVRNALKLPKEYRDIDVGWYELSNDAFTKERYQLKHIGWALHKGMTVKPKEELPDIEYDNLYITHKDRIELTNEMTEEVRNDALIKDPNFARIWYKMKGYIKIKEAEFKNYSTDPAYGYKNFIRDFADFSYKRLKGKPDDWAKNEIWYEPYWDFQDNPQFYKAFKKFKEAGKDDPEYEYDRYDFRNVPTREVWKAYLTYKEQNSYGKLEMRANNYDLEVWLHDAGKVTTNIQDWAEEQRKKHGTVEEGRPNIPEWKRILEDAKRKVKPIEMPKVKIPEY